MSRKSASLNRVLVVKNTDNTITVTFLGSVIMNKVATPIEKSVATRVINSVMDDDERVELCNKCGIPEQLANEAVKNGAGEQFQDDLLQFIEQGFKRVQRTKKSEMQSPPVPKMPKKTKKTKRVEAEQENNGDDDDAAPLENKKKPKRTKKTKTDEEQAASAIDSTPSNGDASDEKVAVVDKEPEAQTQAE